MHHPIRLLLTFGSSAALTSAALVSLGFSLQPQPPTDAAQIRAVVNDQVQALNDRNIAKLANTYCSSDARTLSSRVIDAMPAAGSTPADTAVRVQSIDQITVTGAVATAHVVLVAPHSIGPGLQLSPTGTTNRFERTASGEWQMCSGTAPGAVTV